MFSRHGPIGSRREHIASDLEFTRTRLLMGDTIWLPVHSPAGEKDIMASYHPNPHDGGSTPGKVAIASIGIGTRETSSPPESRFPSTTRTWLVVRS